ncbi:twin-arginine translocase subunit TatC [Caulobacter sp. KR2-114]|uniref:twin-arginine translocase subunit TatC n=1 Tax=Caulobacter sp. KR2-114 TaxID=3400912 RepID=UPI003BFBF2F8
MSHLDDESEIEGSRAPLLDHLIELRKRLIICSAALMLGFLGCFVFSQQIATFLLHPYAVAQSLVATQKASGGKEDGLKLLLALIGKGTVSTEASKFVTTGPLEFFFAKVRLAFFGAIGITFPVLAWQLYRFVAPGLYRRERAAFLPFLIASPVLFVMGAALVYYVMLPFVLWFSLKQQIFGGAGQISVQLLPKIEDYMGLVETLMLAFGLCFQLPVVVTLLGLAGLVDAKMLSQGRRYAIVGVFVVAAVVTPPDPISMISLALPICLLYEISIWCVALIDLRRKREDRANAIVPSP